MDLVGNEAQTPRKIRIVLVLFSVATSKGYPHLSHVRLWIHKSLPLTKTLLRPNAASKINMR